MYGWLIIISYDVCVPETNNYPCVYDMPKIKDQPQIHRAVWKENLTKLKVATKDAKPSNINSLDRQHR